MFKSTKLEVLVYEVAHEDTWFTYVSTKKMKPGMKNISDFKSELL